MASQELKQVTPYCIFVQTDCQREKCAAFKFKRQMTTQEMMRYNSADIPITDPCIYDWCLKYDKQVSIISVIYKTETKKIKEI